MHSSSCVFGGVHTSSEVDLPSVGERQRVTFGSRPRTFSNRPGGPGVGVGDVGQGHFVDLVHACTYAWPMAPAPTNASLRGGVMTCHSPCESPGPLRRSRARSR